MLGAGDRGRSRDQRRNAGSCVGVGWYCEGIVSKDGRKVDAGWYEGASD